ncbi:Tetratricopeptide repeat protein 28 [Acropora cervicornis]|uniref:Tetratricopeptide repeat protein 28 n=1 Tax=Acropora cervicornis TaxID=6130 RepID=A0AAD9V5F0_ACRCE|nr:Tetratricopeptide repeat protein 28 [Acropora cervicornis]
METERNDTDSSQGNLSEEQTEGARATLTEKEAEQEDQLSTLLSSACELLVRRKHSKHYEQAAKLLEQALIKAQEASDEIVEAEVCGKLAEVFLSLDDYAKSLLYGQKCLSLSKTTGCKNLEALAYGCVGNAYSKIGELERGREFLIKSLDANSTTGDQKQKWKCLHNLGVIYSDLGDTESLIRYFRESLTVAENVGDKLAIGECHGGLGSAFYKTGRYLDAIHHNERHLAMAKEVKDKGSEAKACGNLGSIYISKGNYIKAFSLYQQQLTLYKETGDTFGEGNAMGSLGNVYHCRGQTRKAIEYYEAQLNIANMLKNKRAQAQAFGRIGRAQDSLGENRTGEGRSVEKVGNIHFELGDYNKAIECYQQSLDIALAIKDKPLEGASYANLGNSFQALGMYSQAVKIYEKAVPYAKDVADKRMEAQMLGNLGIAYNRIGNHQKELECHLRHLSLCEDLEEKRGEATAHGNIGMVNYRIGNYKEAIKHIEKQISISSSIGDIGGEMAGYLNLGKVRIQLGELTKAIELQQKALSFAEKMGSLEKRGSCHFDLGITYSKLQKYELACDHLEQCTTLYAEMRRLLFEKDVYEISLSDLQASAYRLYTQCLLHQGKDEEALLVTERARSAALADMMVVSYRQQDPSGVKRENLSGAKMREVVLRLGGSIIYYALSGKGKENVIVWSFQSNGDPKFMGEATEWKKLLNEALAEIGVNIKAVECEDRSFLSREAQRRDKNEEIDQLQGLENLTVYPHSKCITPTERPSALEKLYDILLGGAFHDPTAKDLIIVPDEELHRVPFAALQDENNESLAEKHRIRVLPSLSVMKEIFECPSEYHNQKGAVVVGDPDVGLVKLKKSQDPELVTRLDQANKEAQEIGKLVGVKPLIGEKATKARFLKELDNATLVHIAAHGNSETGEIAFAPPPQKRKPILDEEDVVLTMAEVQNAKVRAKLVVLSCCHSARGHIRAEGVIGIARAFLGAGSRSVLASLWAIDDEATMEFMRSFYQHLKLGKKASEALYQATAALRRSEKFRDRLYWAPFVLIGDDVAFDNLEEIAQDNM